MTPTTEATMQTMHAQGSVITKHDGNYLISVLSDDSIMAYIPHNHLLEDVLLQSGQRLECIVLFDNHGKGDITPRSISRVTLCDEAKTLYYDAKIHNN